MALADRRQRVLGVVREGDDVDLGPVVKQGAQTQDHHLVVVHQDDWYGER